MGSEGVAAGPEFCGVEEGEAEMGGLAAVVGEEEGGGEEVEGGGTAGAGETHCRLHRSSASR